MTAAGIHMRHTYCAHTHIEREMNGKTPGGRKWTHFSLYSASFNFSSSNGWIVTNWPISCSMSHHMWGRQSVVLDLCNHSLERIWLLSSEAIVCLCSWNSRGISWIECTLCKITEQLILKRKHLLAQSPYWHCNQMCHITLTLHVCEPTFTLESRRDGCVVTCEKAIKPLTTVQDCVSPLLSDTSHDIFKEILGQGQLFLWKI